MLKLSQGLLTEWLGGTASMKEIFENSTLVLFSGPQPGSANDGEIGTPLVQLTLANGAFTPGEGTNGLNFGTVTWDDANTVATLSKAIAEVWSGIALADGTIGWGRLYANDMVEGESTTARRLDGTATIGGGEFKLSSAVTKTGVPVTVDVCDIKLSAYRR